MAAIQVAPVHARFWSKVEVRGPLQCWPWKAGRSRKGYGLFRLDGRSITASRAAWIITFDERPPDDVLVCHRCDNPPCCKPAHLFIGTPADNVADRNAKGRTVSVARPGESSPAAKLRASTVLAVRYAHEAGASMKELAVAHGVHPNTIQSIVSGRS